MSPAVLKSVPRRMARLQKQNKALAKEIMAKWARQVEHAISEPAAITGDLDWGGGEGKEQ